MLHTLLVSHLGVGLKGEGERSALSGSHCSPSQSWILLWAPCVSHLLPWQSGLALQFPFPSKDKIMSVSFLAVHGWDGWAEAGNTHWSLPATLPKQNCCCSSSALPQPQRKPHQKCPRDPSVCAVGQFLYSPFEDVTVGAGGPSHFRNRKKSS